METGDGVISGGASKSKVPLRMVVAELVTVEVVPEIPDEPDEPAGRLPITPIDRSSNKVATLS